MVDFSEDDVERWLRDIENATIARCDRALAGIEEEHREQLRLSEGPRRLFASLFRGDAGYLAAAAREPDWVSWIEDQPPHLSLASYPAVVIDLVPCAGPEFLAKYGCSPQQLVAMIEHRAHRVYVNIRNHPTDYQSEDVRQTMGTILSCFESKPDSFYRLAPIRERAFSLLGIDLSELETIAGLLTRDYATTMWSHVASAKEARLRTITRPAEWPAPAQLRGRLAYYLAARQLWPEQAGAEQLDAWIGKADAPLQFDPTGDWARPHELLEALSSAHHVHTAQLTGALGGEYGWLPQEMDRAASLYGIAPPYSERFGESPPVGLAQWLFAFLVGRVTAAKPFEPGVLSAWHPPSDAEWMRYLDRADEERARKTIANLSRLLSDVDSSLPGRPLNAGVDAAEVGAYLEYIERNALDVPALLQSAARLSGVAGAVLTTAAVAGVQLVSVPVGVALSALSAAYELSARVSSLSRYREGLAQFIERMSRSNLRRTELRAILRAQR